MKEKSPQKFIQSRDGKKKDPLGCQKKEKKKKRKEKKPARLKTHKGGLGKS